MLLRVGFDRCGDDRLVEDSGRADRVGQLRVVRGDELPIEPPLTTSSCGHWSDRVAAHVAAQLVAGAADERADRAVDRAVEVKRLGKGCQGLVSKAFDITCAGLVGDPAPWGQHRGRDRHTPPVAMGICRRLSYLNAPGSKSNADCP